MTVSAAKLEANRRNAMRSCGPRTQSGKDRSKLNAVKHGMRAATLVLLDEEQRIVDDAVEYSWLRDRARRAHEARLATAYQDMHWAYQDMHCSRMPLQGRGTLRPGAFAIAFEAESPNQNNCRANSNRLASSSLDSPKPSTYRLATGLALLVLSVERGIAPPPDVGSSRHPCECRAMANRDPCDDNSPRSIEDEGCGRRFS
jgi:hypothetical protein